MTPSATYRVQLNAGFTFDDARALVPYLAQLGISHLYASPILRAQPGSQHGYDIIDHNAFNPEIGTAEDFARLVETLRAHGLGLLIDFVPNHMGIGAENRWWVDVLEWGEESPYARYFDIDWKPLRRELAGKVLLPLLGEQYGVALERGEIRLAYERPDGFVLRYYDNRFPIAPPTYAEILGGAGNPELAVLGDDFGRLGLTDGERRAAGRDLVARLAELAASPAAENELAAIVERINADPKRLDALIEQQHYRIAYWRVAGDEINYRRFFDINGLAALRMEDANCFADVHRLVFALVERGEVDGLRIDHIDGLADPVGYCDLLRSRAELLGQDLFIVVEKILARHETLRERWRVNGTTGYEYLSLVAGVLIDPRSEGAMDRIYQRFTRSGEPFEEIVYRCRKLIMQTSLAGELNVLAQRLDKIAQVDPRTRDFTLFGLRHALEELLAAFPVYRTYIVSGHVEDDDRRDLEWALGRARKRDDASEPSIYDFIASVMLDPSGGEEPVRRDRIDFTTRFQQYSAPLAAKGVEDTAFYRYHRLVALNEVGSDPMRFGVSVAAFHQQNAERSRRRPEGLLTTATHDTKRGEDARARIAVLADIPERWGQSAARWAALNWRRRATVEGGPAPDRNDEYLIYQALIGAWPLELLAERPEPAEMDAFLERFEGYLVKALREAKHHSSWVRPDSAYEDATIAFVRKILDLAHPSPFLADFRRFAGTVARFGAYNGLTQVVLRTMGPGIPDTYRGCEFWDFSLVDPDNRRPVDWDARRASLEALDEAHARDGAASLSRALLDAWPDGRIKLYLLWRLLTWRRAHPEAFARGAYAPLDAAGRAAEHVVAFRAGEAIVVTSRLTARLLGDAPGHPIGEVWAETTIASAPRSRYVNVLTGAAVEPDGGRLALDRVLADIPVAVLEPAAELSEPAR